MEEHKLEVVSTPDESEHVASVSELVGLLRASRDSNDDSDTEEASGSVGLPSASDDESSDDEEDLLQEQRIRGLHRLCLVLVAEYISLQDAGRMCLVSQAWRRGMMHNRTWHRLYEAAIGKPTMRRLLGVGGINWKWELLKQRRAHTEMLGLELYQRLGAHEDQSTRSLYWELKRRAAMSHDAEHMLSNVLYRRRRHARQLDIVVNLAHQAKDVLGMREKMMVRVRRLRVTNRAATMIQ